MLGGAASKTRRPTVLAAALALVASLAVPVLTGAGAGPGRAAEAALPARADYLAVRGLSAPVHRTVRTTHRVPAADGTALYVEVTRPVAPGRWPVVLEASPYHGTLADRDGTRILPHPFVEGRSIGLTGYFAPRGYAVVMVDLRGTGRSAGCLDHLAGADAADLVAAVEWAASQPWSNGRVGMTGHSYVGATAAVAAAQRPRGLVTVVPSAGLASMYDHQFQAGVPYYLQWVGPMFAYEEIALFRGVPEPVGYGDDTGNNAAQTGCGIPQSSLVAGEAQLSGQYVDWHAQRDWSAGATASPIPVFLVHGVNDDAARIAAASWFTARRRPGDKLWLGQWNHGSGCCPNRRRMQWTAALHAWFDRHLAGRPVDTGPPVELFLADGDLDEVRAGARTEVLTARVWPPPSRPLSLWATPQRRLGGPGTTGSTEFTSVAGEGRVDFVGEPVRSDVVLAGVPRLDLAVSVTAPRLNLIATVYDDDGRGTRRRITQFAMNPELRHDIRVRSVVVPGQRYLLRPPGFDMAHRLRAGHRLVLRVATSDPDKVTTFATDAQVRVFAGPGGTRLELPVVREGVDVRSSPDDVPVPTG